MESRTRKISSSNNKKMKDSKIEFVWSEELWRYEIVKKGKQLNFNN